MTRRVQLLLPLCLACAAPAAAQAQSPNAIDVPIASGGAVHVEFSDAAGGLNPDLAGAYVGCLDSLPHGNELRHLTVRVASVDQIAGLCGGLEREGILACYEARQNRMNVPNVGLDATNGVYTLRYVLTHEYGHHVAHHRPNPGFKGGSVDWGPKLWASQQLVCNGVKRHQLFPGSERPRSRYLANPGEAWAEAYARLAFPDQPWTFTGRLAPDPVALDAARRDVVEPWTKNRGVAAFTMSAKHRTQRFAVPLNLDGTVKVLVRGPRRSEVGVRLRLNGRSLGSSHKRGRTDTLTRKRVCRSAPTQNLTITAVRHGRRGPTKLLVSYPG
jgi:hypothetical protein